MLSLVYPSSQFPVHVDWYCVSQGNCSCELATFGDVEQFSIKQVGTELQFPLVEQLPNGILRLVTNV